MEIKIFDVEHGFCSLIVTDNHRSILIDCGHNSTTNFRPSNYMMKMGVNIIDLFIITNYDEDHLSDLPNIIERGIFIKRITYNGGISTKQLRDLKTRTTPLGPGIKSLIRLLENITYYYDIPTIVDEITFSHECFDYTQFQDTNNLSLVTFLDYKDIHIIFPGDMEVEGWKEILKSAAFCEKLKSVNLFIASHHGRESGYCDQIFSYCKPDLILVSDGVIQYDTQKNFYGKYSKGVRFGNDIRYVLTTRYDGCITIRQDQYSSVSINCNRTTY